MAVQVRNGRVDIEVPTDDSARQCARLLKDHSSGPSAIKSIDLRKGVVTSAGAGAIAKALKGNSSLRHLGLQGNGVGDVGVAAIGRSVEANVGCALTSLDLSATGITVVGLSNLVQGVSNLPGLHTVCLGENNLGQEAGHQLSNLFKSSASLHTLLAGGNYLGDRGLAALCGAFCYLNPARVVSLDVSGNGIGDLGMQWLCKGISALCRNQNQPDAPTSGRGGGGAFAGGVRDLRLRGNNITHAGAKDLAKLLSEERCAHELRELDLSLNTITADGFLPLAVSLRGCRELVRLDVAGCRLGPGGVAAAAEFIAAAGPKLTTVILAPKAEFADRVLGDRGGLALALKQALERLAGSLTFAGSVVELNLGPFLRADPSSAASIEETLRENRARAATAAAAARGARGGSGGGGGGESARRDGGGSVRANDKSRGAGTTPKTGTSSGGRVRGEASGAGVTPGSSGRRGNANGTPQQRSGASTASARARESSRVRATGMDRPRAGVERTRSGLERSRAGTGDRVRRGATGGQGTSGAGGSSATTPPPPGSASTASSSSLHRASSKSSVRSASSTGMTSGRSSGHAGSVQRAATVTGAATSTTTAATLAAHDKAAAAEAPAPHRRMHQGEELDSIDGFSQIPTRNAAVAAAEAAARRCPSSRDRGMSAIASGTVSDSAAWQDGSKKKASPGGSSGVDAIADVVSKVMGDTEALVGQETPPSVAPSTWQFRGENGDENAPSDGRSVAESSTPSEAAQSPLPPSPASVAAADYTTRLPQSVVPAHAAGAPTAEEGQGRKKIVRKSSSGSVVDHGEPELAAGLASLVLKEERRPPSNSRSQENSLDVSSGPGGQQLVTMAEAGRLLGPLVALEVEKETKKLEIRMQNEMNSALRTMRSDMEAIDREGLMARVAMEKRLKTGIKRLLDRIDHLERRFARLEREDRKRLALEASPTSASTSTTMSTASLSPSQSPSSSPPSCRNASAVDAPNHHHHHRLAEAGVASASSSSSQRRTLMSTTGEKSEGTPPHSTASAAAAAAAAAATPESRPLVVKKGWRAGVDVAGGVLPMGGRGSEEEFEDSGEDDESEADIVRMLEEKMAALEGKLLGHEERQRSDPRAGTAAVSLGAEEGFGQGSAVWA